MDSLLLMHDEKFVNEVYIHANRFLERCLMPPFHVDLTLRDKTNKKQDKHDEEAEEAEEAEDNEDDEVDQDWDVQTHAFCALESLAHSIAGNYAALLRCDASACASPEATKQRILAISYYQMMLCLHPATFGRGDDDVLSSIMQNEELRGLMKDAMAFEASKEAAPFGRQFEVYQKLKMAFASTA